MTKRILEDTEFTFDASLKTITFTEVIIQKHILLITNITDNIIIYNFACEGFGGVVSGKTLTLEYNTTLMEDTDLLSVIIYEEDKGVETNNLLTLIREQNNAQNEIIEELKLQTKYLRKIYNPE